MQSPPVSCPRKGLAVAAVSLLSLLVVALAAEAADRVKGLPRFTEEREVASLFFVKKHVPEVLPLLDELKKSNTAQYQQEISETFLVTELLADLQDQPRRYELELKIWKTETRAAALVASLSTPATRDRQTVEAALRQLARELVDLDIQILELRAEQLDRELGEVRDDLSRSREQLEEQVQLRYQRLESWSKKGKK